MLQYNFVINVAIVICSTSHFISIEVCTSCVFTGSDYTKNVL